jgi:putative two-component system hydrogenase maturation factor HypX/HoxX
VVLNPRYKDMGNPYGSEYWTYLLPRRAGDVNTRRVSHVRLPIGVGEARRLDLVDRILPAAPAAIAGLARQLAADPALAARLAKKRRCRDADEAAKPLAAYREEEPARIRRDFYGFDPGYHVVRYNFIHNVPKSRTPLTLARHRRAMAKLPPTHHSL